MDVMADASLVEQRIEMQQPGQLQGRAGTVDCEVLTLSRRGAEVRFAGDLGGEREVFLALRDFGHLSCRVVKVNGDLAELSFQGDPEAQDAMFQDIIARLGDDEGRRRYLRRSVLWPGTLTCGRAELACTILNMSLGGAKIALSEARDCGGGVTLLGDRFEGLPATVVWQRGRLVGLQFRQEPAAVASVLGDLLPAIKASA
jgi:hypothetical protein